jgi:hypothetical protein
MTVTAWRGMLLGLIAMAAAMAQDQTGRIEGVVVDSASHQPVKTAMVSINFYGMLRNPGQYDGPQTATTDATGTFAFDGLPAGQYQLTVMHQNYPGARMGGVQKTVHVAAGDTAASITVELIPGAAIAGHVVDEDGDGLGNCMIQVHSARNFNQSVPIMRSPLAGEDGGYRIHGIPPGKYTITAQCAAPVFRPRPLSEGPDPPPSSAYPMQFYPGANELKSAQVVELLPGAEKSGIDFQMRPIAVTHIHGALVAGSADWRGRDDLRVQLMALDRHGVRNGNGSGGQINKDGSFDLREVFPGSYRLAVFSQNLSGRGFQPDGGDGVGAITRVDVTDKPIEVTLPLQRAVDIAGTVEIERGNNASDSITADQINLQLTAENGFGRPPTPTQVNKDGSFMLKSVLPGEWRIRMMGRSAFVKSARLGSDDVTNRPLDLSSGSAQPLRIVVSTNTATIRGTAPAGQMVYSAPREEDEPLQVWRAAQVDSSGQFKLQGLPPGKYRVLTVDGGGPMPEEGGQEVTVSEGETVTIEMKAEGKP